MHYRLTQLINSHNEFRDRITEQIHKDWNFNSGPYSLVLVRMFTYAFNTYKAIGLLAPELYYEHCSSLLRTLWEVSLDLHWISQMPERRSAMFLNFTVLEYRKSLQDLARKSRKRNKYDEADLIDRKIIELDRIASQYLENYTFINKRGRSQFVSEFSGKTPDLIAKELGAEWVEEYDRIYKLTCAYVHGAPKAILFPLQILNESEEYSTFQDEERTAKTLVWSVAIMAKTYNLLCENIGLNETEYFDGLSNHVPYKNAFAKF